MPNIEDQIKLVREGDFIMTMLEDIDDVLENEEYLTEEQVEETYNQRRKLKRRLLEIKTELFVMYNK